MVWPDAPSRGVPDHNVAGNRSWAKHVALYGKLRMNENGHRTQFS